MDANDYLMELVRYIHLNPWRAKLEDAPGIYPWTSHRQYMGKDQKALAPVEVKVVLGFFSKVRAKARRDYFKFFGKGLDQGHLVDFYNLRNGRILGSETFEEEVYKVTRAENKAELKISLSLSEIWEAILAREGFKQEPGGWVRTDLMDEAAYWAVEAGGLKQKTAAAYFGLADSAVSKAIRRLKKSWESDQDRRRKS